MNIINTVGKVKESVLKRSVLKEILPFTKKMSQEIGVGIDGTCFMADGDKAMTIAAAVMEGTGEEFVSCVFYRALNNILVKQAVPYGITVSVMLRAKEEEENLKKIMRILAKECEKNKVIILGGETQSSDTAKKTVISITMLGKGGIRTKQEVKPGFEIVMAGQAGKAATVILSEKNEDELKKRFNSVFFMEGKQLKDNLSIASIMQTDGVKDALYCHDVSEGGIFAALWETGEALKCGMSVNLSEILFAQQTIELCEYFDRNPYQLFSLGAVIFVTEHGAQLVKKLQEKNIPAAVIGEITESHDRIVRNEDETRFLEPFKGDEIYQ